MANQVPDCWCVRLVDAEGRVLAEKRIRGFKLKPGGVVVNDMVFKLKAGKRVEGVEIHNGAGGRLNFHSYMLPLVSSGDGIVLSGIELTCPMECVPVG